MKSEVYAVATSTAALHVSGIILAKLVASGMISFTDAVEMVDGAAALSPDIVAGSISDDDRQAFLQAYLTQLNAVHSLLEAARPDSVG